MFDTDLATCPAGPRLARMLDAIDVATLDSDQSLVYVAAVFRQRAWTDARLIEATARFAERRGDVEDPDPAGEEPLVRFGGDGSPASESFAPDELAPELRQTSDSAARLIADSLDLMHRLPRVWITLRIGLIDVWRARMVAEATRDLSAESAAAVEDEILGRIGRLTPSRLHQAIDRIMARVEPEPADRAAASATLGRRLTVDPTTHDHAEIRGLVGIADALRLDTRLDEIADLLATDASERDETHDQRRARALGLLADPTAVADLERRAAGGDRDPAALPRTTLYVHLRPDQTFDLERYSVLSLPTVAQLLADSTVTINPVIDLGHLESSSDDRPSAALREGVILTSSSCVFPFCEHDSRRCQLDHAIPYPRGQTDADNLGPLCPRHHRVKNHGRWRLRQPFQGIFVWVSPTGRVYTVDGRGTHVLAA